MSFSVNFNSPFKDKPFHDSIKDAALHSQISSQGHESTTSGFTNLNSPLGRDHSLTTGAPKHLFPQSNNTRGRSKEQTKSFSSTYGSQVSSSKGNHPQFQKHQKVGSGTFGQSTLKFGTSSNLLTTFETSATNIAFRAHKSKVNPSFNQTSASSSSQIFESGIKTHNQDARVGEHNSFKNIDFNPNPLNNDTFPSSAVKSTMTFGASANLVKSTADSFSSSNPLIDQKHDSKFHSFDPFMTQSVIKSSNVDTTYNLKDTDVRHTKQPNTQNNYTNISAFVQNKDDVAKINHPEIQLEKKKKDGELARIKAEIETKRKIARKLIEKQKKEKKYESDAHLESQSQSRSPTNVHHQANRFSELNHHGRKNLNTGTLPFVPSRFDQGSKKSTNFNPPKISKQKNVSQDHSSNEFKLPIVCTPFRQDSMKSRNHELSNISEQKHSRDKRKNTPKQHCENRPLQIKVSNPQTRNSLPLYLVDQKNEKNSSNACEVDTKTKNIRINSLVGLCSQMCPNEEILRREAEGDVQLLELPYPNSIHPQTWELQNTMVKRFRRSAADFKLDIPELVRHPVVLERTVSYLEEWVMERDRQGPDQRYIESNITTATVPPPLDVYQFVWDRTRMIRKDFTLQNYIGTGGRCDAVAVRCHERIARWHVMVEHQLSHLPEFVRLQSQQNIQELGQTMKTLNLLYDDAEGRSVNDCDIKGSTIINVNSKDKNELFYGCSSSIVMGPNPVDYDGTTLWNKSTNSSFGNKFIQGKIIPSSSKNGTSEAEMRGLYILLTLNNDGGMEVLKFVSRLSSEQPDIFNSQLVQLALKVYKAWKECNYARFFQILRDPSTPYLYSCLMYKYVAQMRKDAIRLMSKSYGNRKRVANSTNTPELSSVHDSYPLNDFIHLLCFEDMNEARNACKHFNIFLEKVEVRAQDKNGSKITNVEEVILWKRSDFREPRDESKGTIIQLKPRKMIRTIESKLKGATRLAVCRSEDTVIRSSSSNNSVKSITTKNIPKSQLFGTTWKESSENRSIEPKTIPNATNKMQGNESFCIKEDIIEKEDAQAKYQSESENKRCVKLSNEKTKKKLTISQTLPITRKDSCGNSLNKSKFTPTVFNQKHVSKSYFGEREIIEEVEIAKHQIESDMVQCVKLSNEKDAEIIFQEKADIEQKDEIQIEIKPINKSKIMDEWDTQQLRSVTANTLREKIVKQVIERQPIAFQLSPNMKNEADVKKQKHEIEAFERMASIKSSLKRKLQNEESSRRKILKSLQILQVNDKILKEKEEKLQFLNIRQENKKRFAKMLIILKIWSTRVNRYFSFSNSTLNTLEKMDPTSSRLALSPSKSPSSISNNLRKIVSLSDERQVKLSKIDKKCIETYFFRIGTRLSHKIDLSKIILSYFKNGVCGVSKGNMLTKRFYEQKKRNVLLFKLSVLVLDDKEHKDATSALIRTWINSRLGFGLVFSNEDSTINRVEVRTVTVDISEDPAAFEGSDATLVVVPPLTNIFAVKSMCMPLVPASNQNHRFFVLNFNDDKNEENRKIISHLLNAFKSEDNDRVMSFCVGSNQYDQPDILLNRCCDILVSDFFFSSIIGFHSQSNVEQLSLEKLTCAVLRSTINVSPLKRSTTPDSFQMYSRLVINHCRLILRILVEELQTIALYMKEERKISHWPANEFFDPITKTVRNYFSYGKHLPRDWNNIITSQPLEVIILKLYPSLRDSYLINDFVRDITLQAPPHIRQCCGELIRQKNIILALQSALQWKESCSLTKFTIFLPSMFGSKIIEHVVMKYTASLEGHSNCIRRINIGVYDISKCNEDEIADETFITSHNNNIP